MTICRSLLLSIPFVAALGVAFPAEEPRSKEATAQSVSNAKPLPKITISKETTYITEPLRPDGYVDYVAAINRRCSEGVTPENNAVIPFWQAVGPKSIDTKVRQQYFKMLGMADLSESGDYVVSFSDFVDHYFGRKQSDWDTPEDAERMQAADRQHRQAQKRPWSKPEFPMVAALLDRNAKPLGVFVAGTHRSRYYSPLVASDGVSLVSTLGQSGMANARDLVRCLTARAMLRLHEGKIADAWQDILACHRWARLTSRGPYLVDYALASTWSRDACIATVAVAQHGNLTTGQAGVLASDLNQLPRARRTRDTLEFGERLFGLGCLLDVAICGSRRLDEDISPIAGMNFLSLLGLDESQPKVLRQLADAPQLDWNEALRYFNTWYDRVVKAHDKPIQAERVKAHTQIDEEVAALAKQAAAPPSTNSGHDPNAPKALARQFVCLLNAGGLLTGQTMLNAENISRTYRNLASLALALAGYRSDHDGVYPKALSELVPKYIADVPADTFTDGDLHYSLDGGGYLLYSVGPNGKDDGGRNYWEEHQNWSEIESLPTAEEESWDDIAIRTPPKASKSFPGAYAPGY